MITIEDALVTLLKRVPPEAIRGLVAGHVLPAFSSELNQVHMRIDKLEKAAKPQPKAEVEITPVPDSLDTMLLEAFNRHNWDGIERYLTRKGLIKPRCMFLYGNHTTKSFDTPKEMLDFIKDTDDKSVTLLYVEMMTIGKEHWHAALGSSNDSLFHKTSMLNWVSDRVK